MQKQTTTYQKMRLKSHIAAALLAIAAAASPQGASAAAPDILSPLSPGYIATASQMLAGNIPAGCIDQLGRLIFADPSARGDEKVWYMLAKASYDRGEISALQATADFLRSFPASPDAPRVALMHADLLFFSGGWAEARKEYLALGIDRVEYSKRPAYEYRLAFCRLKTGEYGLAKSAFSRLANNPEYALPARFYTAYADYAEGNLQEALGIFRSIKGRKIRQETGSRLYPQSVDPEPYIAQILFSKGDFAEAAQAASRLAADESLPAEMRLEMKRVAGESYFKLGDTAEARHYLSEYLADPASPRVNSAVYDAGAIAYADGSLSEAESLFRQLISSEDQIAQGAYLYLGQIAMSEGDNTGAAIYFEKAHRLGYDRNVAETALYNYAAARIAGGNVPFSSSAPMLESFVKTFPGSKYLPAVKQYLASVYFNEKDYRKALANAESVKRPDRRTLSVMQQSLYQLGVQAAANSQWDDAAACMRKCSRVDSDPKLASQALLWEGEALYAAGSYRDAETVLKQAASRSASKADKALALYDLAYSLYMQEKYREGLGYFRQAASDRSLPEALRADATVRQADCSYYTGNWREAKTLYAKAAGMKSDDDGYLTLRQAAMSGLAGDTDAEISALAAFVASHPESKWAANARTSLASAYSRKGDTKKAASTLRDIISAEGNSAAARKASLDLALLYYNSKSTAEAEKEYRAIISRWPTSEEAIAADQDLRRIYAADGRIDEYARFISSIPGAPKPDSGELEKLAFEAAESLWNDDITATRRLEEFVGQYPQGRYLAPALLCLAESAKEAGNYEKALGYLDRILQSRPDSQQASTALAEKADILRLHFPDRKNEALAAYRRLLQTASPSLAPRAYEGIMLLTSDPNESLQYASLLLSSSGTSPQTAAAARLAQASAMLRTGNAANGVKLLRELAADPLTEAGSEAAVTLGEYLLSQKKYADAAKVLEDFTASASPHDYWIARAYITLADTLAARGDKASAREYVKSLKENYPGDEDDIRRMINTRLNNWK